MSELSLQRPRSSRSDGSSLSRVWTFIPNQSRPEIEINFVNTLDCKHECPVCCQVLRSPVQFGECGHRCCSYCLQEILRVAPKCPIDQTRIELDKVYADEVYQREIDVLAVKCCNHARGCTWQGQLCDLVSHSDGCLYTLLACPTGCGVEFERRFVGKHVEKECSELYITCYFCKSSVHYEDEAEHLLACPKFPLPCPNGCQMEIPQEEVPAHMDNDCPIQKVPCPFAETGCEFKAEREDIKTHVKEEMEIHLEMVCTTLIGQKRILEQHCSSVEKQSEKLTTVEGKIESLEKLYGSQLVWKIDNYQEKLTKARSGKKPVILSPPFLTSRHGYKLALSACLYGDGKAKSKYMSLYFCICRGEYDALLLWPFSHRVTFTLIDQSQDPAARRNVTYSIKPNTCKENNIFVGRPLGERNASFGAQKFVELEVMSTLDYIRDDTMFIKVNID